MIINKKIKHITYNINFYNNANSFKLLAFIIDSCNYTCEYCYNDLPRTNKKIDLNKLYFFITEILLKKLKKEYIWLELIGGEPTLHPDLVEFCEKISKIDNINTTIYTNFSKSVDYYIKLLEIDKRISLILSWHNANFQFKEKINKIPRFFLEKNITVSVIYEHKNIKNALEIFDYIHIKHPYIKELSFPLIDENINYCVEKYTTADINEYKKRLPFVKDLTKIKIQYKDNTYKIVDQHYFITDETRKNFKYWMCNVGIDFCFIYFNSDICICDGYRDKKMGNLNSDNLINLE